MAELIDEEIEAMEVLGLSISLFRYAFDIDMDLEFVDVEQKLEEYRRRGFYEKLSLTKMIASRLHEADHYLPFRITNCYRWCHDTSMILAKDSSHKPQAKDLALILDCLHDAMALKPPLLNVELEQGSPSIMIDYLRTEHPEYNRLAFDTFELLRDASTMDVTRAICGNGYKEIIFLCSPPHKTRYYDAVIQMGKIIPQCPRLRSIDVQRRPCVIIPDISVNFDSVYTILSFGDSLCRLPGIMATQNRNNRIMDTVRHASLTVFLLMKQRSLYMDKNVLRRIAKMVFEQRWQLDHLVSIASTLGLK